MDTAKDRRNHQEYTALQVSEMTDEQRRVLKPHLRCPHCEATAHFRSASRPSAARRGRVAHFYCLPHGEECNITRNYADPWEDEENDRTVSQWERRNVTLIVRVPTSAEDAPAESGQTENSADDESRSRGGGDRTRASTSLSRGPQRLLEQLVEWPSFKTSTTRLRMPDPSRTEMPVHDAFVRFEMARPEQHTARWHGFWGVVQPLTYWALGETYFSNFGAFHRSFRIAIHRARVPEILSRYNLSHINDLVGHYLLLFDHARESSSGRFMADVNSMNHIGFIRTGQPAA